MMIVYHPKMVISMSSNRKDLESSSTTCLNQSKMLYLQFGKRNRQTDQKGKKPLDAGSFTHWRTISKTLLEKN